MAEKLGDDQLITVEELAISQSYEIAALVAVLERKGILTREEIISAIKELKRS